MLKKYSVKTFEFAPEEIQRMQSIENKFLMKFSARLCHFTKEEREDKAREFLIDEYMNLGKILSSEEVEMRIPFLSGFDVLDPLIADADIEEILINGTESPVLIYHRKQGKCQTNVLFENKEVLDRIVKKIMLFCGIKDKGPIIDAALPEGPRVNCTLPPVSFDKSVITIRKYLENPPTVIELIKNGTMTVDMAALLWICVEGFGVAQRNILISGGTSCGKTTMLNALLPFARESDRIVSIEDTIELDFNYCPDWVRTVTSEYADMEKLIENSLRLRPDWVVVGEVRGNEAFNLINAMNLGHTGIGTMHAESARDAVLKLTAPPMNVDMRMLVALDIIIVITRFNEGSKSRRVISHITEVGNIMEGQVQLGSVYKYNAKTKKTEFSKFPALTIGKIADISGVTPKDVLEEIKKREIILTYLTVKGVSRLEDFVWYVREYYKNPKAFMMKIKAEKQRISE